MLYSISIYLYIAAVHLASTWNAKAKAWISGRKQWKQRLQAIRQDAGSRPLVWVHCASLGEFEQGRPVIENLCSLNPKPYILLSFFSPSGYEVRKHYPQADAVIYLPADTPANATYFVQRLKPSLAIFVKYEYWLNLLAQLHQQQVPVLMISAIFRNNQVFFKWYGSVWRKALTRIHHFFVQDNESHERLQRLGITEVTVAGDTRFDRVLQLAGGFKEIPEIASFCGTGPVWVVGSTWAEDENIIADYLKQQPHLKCIIAPHEINHSHLAQIEQLIPGIQRFSIFQQQPRQGVQVLLMDNIGMLSRLYHYATITYIGGGFGKGIHNTLEAAVYGKPVLFGPRYEKFREARDLISTGAAFSITNSKELAIKMDELLHHPDRLSSAGNSALAYVREQAGATEKIMDYIQAKRLLTS